MDKVFYKNLLTKILEKHNEYENQEKMVMEKINIISIRDRLIAQNKNVEDYDLYRQVCNEIFSDSSVQKLEEELKMVRAKIAYCKDIIRSTKEEYGIDFAQNDVLFEFLKPKAPHENA